MKRLIGGLGTALLGMAGFATAQADTVINVTQYSYNYNNQVVCTAVRMNPATFGALSSDACTPMTSVGSNGPDRITANLYDAAGQLTAIEQAYGTSNVRVYASYTYTNNGLKQTETDANNNTTTFVYDGFDRLVTLQYPNTTLSSGTSSTTDYETFTYDDNDNRKTWRRRNTQTITYTYDNLNREVIADVPAVTGVYNATEKDIYTTYDAFGRVTKKAFASYTGANNVSYTYNGLGWVATTTDMGGRTISYLYNAAGARLRLTDQEGYYVAYSLDNLNRIQKATLNGTTNVLFSYTYNAIGQMTQLTKGAAGTGGGTTTYAYDDLGRVQGMAVAQATTGYDITWGKVGTTGAVAYNAANQITTWASSSNIFDYVETTTAPENRTFDGLNRDATLAAVSGGYDANGNLTKDNPRVFVYDIYNRLLTATGGANNISLVYDPEGRLVQTTTALGSKEYLYDGTNLITEYSNGGTTPASRYIHGSGTDNPIVWLKGADDSDRRYYYTNYQGSVVGYVGAAGQFVTGGLTRYNAYGQPQNNAPTPVEVWPGTRFGYTGQVVLSDAYLYYYKARVYDPKHGRFLQTDPVGSADDLDLYSYVGGDPINNADPTGLVAADSSMSSISNQICTPEEGTCVTVRAERRKRDKSYPQCYADDISCQQNAFMELKHHYDEANQGFLWAGVGPWAVLMGGEAVVAFSEVGEAGALNARWSLGQGKTAQKWQNQMSQRGWTDKQIDDAVQKGKQFPAVNNANGNPATRYVNPNTGRSVVVDNVTREVIHVGGDGFKY